MKHIMKHTTLINQIDYNNYNYHNNIVDKINKSLNYLNTEYTDIVNLFTNKYINFYLNFDIDNLNIPMLFIVFVFNEINQDKNLIYNNLLPLDYINNIKKLDVEFDIYSIIYKKLINDEYIKRI
ncbi:hypothetical protein BCR32DRAFT_286823 [Anaeromyces robustus]|uniref:Uncharacterized protein n=1 Tax=Anaeromyces robustus TaxID=1754192 RepID=A0A1Y1VU97_9FUNG|nr:hypothetical protein BCR32DRAFT_286823 [Anaeromyces robustus]|eukprot:ORX64847.1 hypothetical protein BCR32DRAFT_286823 [Anaeromyces robustus]